MEMLLTGDLIDALTAKEYGLINRVVPYRDLNDTVLEIAKKILKKSSKTIATGKKAFYEQLELGVSEAYKFTSEIMTDNMTEYNAQEGVDAFLQKRSPVWKD
jgi:enoyl-CoA hydratase/carnithine racemase